MRIKLKIAIIEKFGNQANFARIIGKRDDWLSRVITNRSNPNKEERRLILSKLGLGEEVFENSNIGVHV